MTSDHRPVIGQLVHTLNVGGAEVLAGNLARRLRDQFRFVFFCLDELGVGADRLRSDGFPVEVIGRRDGLDWRCPGRLAARWREYGVELIQAHQYTPFFYSLLARFRFGSIPLIFTEHGRHYPDYPRPKRKFANRLLLRRSDRVVAVGRSVKQALIDNEGFGSERIEVIPNGIDVERFQPSETDRQSVRAELGIEPDDYLVLMVARLDPIKDHITALKAVAAACNQVPSIKLILVGDGPERQRIESTIHELQLESRVHLLGTRHDVPRLLTAADTLLLTSLSEGIPLTVIEAMATRIPIIGTNVGSMADVLTEDVGRLAQAQDHLKLSEYLIQLAQSESLRQTLGIAGRQRAAAEFSETGMADRYAHLFKNVLGLNNQMQETNATPLTRLTNASS